MTIEGPATAAEGPQQALARVRALAELAIRARAIHTLAEAQGFATELARAEAGEAPAQAQPPAPPTVAAAPPAYSEPPSYPVAIASAAGQPLAGAGQPSGGTPAAALSQQRIETSGAAPYAQMIVEAAQRNGIEPALLFGLIEQESGFNPSAQSPAGALGLTQLMPSTASSLGVREPLDPRESIEGGARYLAEMLHRFNGNVEDALAAYNAGPGAVQAAGGVPPIAETQAYVADVLANARSFTA